MFCSDVKTSIPHPIVCLLLELLLDLLMSLLQNFPVLWWAFLPFVLLFLQSTGKLSMANPNILQCHQVLTHTEETMIASCLKL